MGAQEGHEQHRWIHLYAFSEKVLRGVEAVEWEVCRAIDRAVDGRARGDGGWGGDGADDGCGGLVHHDGIRYHRGSGAG